MLTELARLLRELAFRVQKGALDRPTVVKQAGVIAGRPNIGSDLIGIGEHLIEQQALVDSLRHLLGAKDMEIRAAKEDAARGRQQHQAELITQKATSEAALQAKQANAQALQGRNDEVNALLRTEQLRYERDTKALRAQVTDLREQMRNAASTLSRAAK